MFRLTSIVTVGHGSSFNRTSRVMLENVFGPLELLFRTTAKERLSRGRLGFGGVTPGMGNLHHRNHPGLDLNPKPFFEVTVHV